MMKPEPKITKFFDILVGILIIFGVSYGVGQLFEDRPETPLPGWTLVPGSNTHMTAPTQLPRALWHQDQHGVRTLWQADCSTDSMIALAETNAKYPGIAPAPWEMERLAEFGYLKKIYPAPGSWEKYIYGTICANEESK